MTSANDRANAIRALAMDAVQQANSGHPGAPMGLADVAQVLWGECLRFNPNNPNWANRDRVVLSNGHASMLLYAVLYLTGYELSLEDIKNFRQLHAKAAGHPEYGECPGVETTTGPLGQGLANAVGMALAEKRLAYEFNQDSHEIVDHKTWVIVGDGCLMEGISHEAASFAGTMQLGKLIAIYDNNGISIDGPTDAWFTEDVVGRFRAYGWRVIPHVDGHDPHEIRRAFEEATSECSKPTLIDCRTTIGYGAPTQAGTEKAHGSPLGAEEISGTRRALDWKHEPFVIPEHIRQDWDMQESGAQWESSWISDFETYSRAFPQLAEEFERRTHGTLPCRLEQTLVERLDQVSNEPNPVATRKASGNCLDAIGPIVPELIGGSADLSGSNNTEWKGSSKIQNGGRYVNFGVREFGMTAIANGLALHGGFIPYTGTFLVFMEYARNAARLAALMGIRQILVYTHDSVGLGEDGPTHQPIEQLTNLRTTPNLSVWRPCDEAETIVAWRSALQRDNGPTALILSRQSTPPQERTKDQIQTISMGGYILRKEKTELDLTFISTGSEVGVARDAASQLEEEGLGVRVVSMPSVDTFLQQSQSYQDTVLPPEIKARVAVEAAHPDYWHKFVGLDGAVVGIDRFGVSSPGDIAMHHLGIHADAVVATARTVLD